MSFVNEQAALPERKPFFLYFAITAPHAPDSPRTIPRSTRHGDECDFVCRLMIRWAASSTRWITAGSPKTPWSSSRGDNGSPGFADEGAPTASVIARYGHYPNGAWRGMKGDAHEGGHRIPFIARWPGRVPAGTSCTETVCLVDLMATCAGASG